MRIRSGVVLATLVVSVSCAAASGLGDRIAASLCEQMLSPFSLAGADLQEYEQGVYGTKSSTLFYEFQYIVGQDATCKATNPAGNCKINKVTRQGHNLYLAALDSSCSR